MAPINLDGVHSQLDLTADSILKSDYLDTPFQNDTMRFSLKSGNAKFIEARRQANVGRSY